MITNGLPVRNFPALRRWSFRIGLTAALAGWMALIFYLSSLPGEQVSRMGPYDSDVIAKLGSLRCILGHLLLFGLLAAFIQAAIWSWTTFTNHSLRFAIFAVILAILYGISDEFHQLFVEGRYMSASDMLVNALGASAAVATLRQLVKKAFHSAITPLKFTAPKI